MANTEISDKTIKVLEAKGFKRWQRGSYDRLYVDAEQLGLDCDYYKHKVNYSILR